MVITAPGLFSTTTFQPSASDNALAMMRARMSGGVLAENGTTMRMTLDGKDCANADPKAAPPQATAAAPARNSRRFIAFPFVCRPPVRDGPQPGETACVKARTKGYPNSSLPDNIIVYRLITSRNERSHAVG